MMPSCPEPIAAGLYCEDQKREAKQAAAAFVKERISEISRYFETVLARNPRGRGFLVGANLTYPDLSLFQVVEGLRCAFPEAMRRAERKAPRVVALRDRVRARARIAAYLSLRRAAFRSTKAAFSGAARSWIPEIGRARAFAAVASACPRPAAGYLKEDFQGRRA